MKPLSSMSAYRDRRTAATDQELLSWFAKIAEPLKALYGVEFEVALIAWELARWQPGFGLLERQALIVLVLTVIVHLQEGSTRIRLRGDQGRALRLDTANRLLDDIDSSPATPSVAPCRPLISSTLLLTPTDWPRSWAPTRNSNL